MMQFALAKSKFLVLSLLLFVLFTFYGVSNAEDGARLVIKPMDSIVELNTKINFFCRSDGNPVPSVSWKRNGKPISQARYTPETLLNGMSTLRIEPVRDRDNDSEITCTADNGRGLPVNASAKLYVFKTEDLPVGFPTIIEDPKLRAVEKGGSATMNCNVHGIPAPDVIWLKDLMPVDMGNPRYSIATLGNPGSFVIQNSEEIDEGKYECMARNPKGVAQSRSAHLYVKIRRVPPHFSIPPRRVYQVMPGGNVNMTCVAVGHPMPKVFWRRAHTNEDLERPDAAPSGKNVLVLTNVQKTENFSCVAFSNLGNINAEVTVEVKALPDPPENLKVTNVSARSVALTWTHARPSPSITDEKNRFYVLRYKPKYSDGEGYLESEPTKEPQTIVSGLEPYTEYEFRVLTIGDVGRGKPSRPVEITTGEALPETPPKSVQSRPLGTTNILVQWEPPEKPNGQLTAYKVYYSNKDNDPSNMWPSKEILEGKMAQINDLMPDMLYSVRVQAKNSAGYGPLSEPVLVYTKTGIPGQPMNIKATAIGPNQVAVSWEPPLHPDVRNYIVRYNMSATDLNSVEVAGTVNDYKINALKPNTDYSFQIVAKSQRGEGAPSKIVTIRTSASVPSGSPEGVVVEALSSNQIRVIWEPPTKSTQNGLITSYRITATKKNENVEDDDDEDDDDDDEAATSLTADDNDGSVQRYEQTAEKQRSFVVENLHSYTLYRITVAAGTSVGYGPESLIAEVRTHADETSDIDEEALYNITILKLPGPPRDVQVVVVNETTAKLSWLEPIEKNGPLTGYIVDYDELDKENQFISKSPTRHFSLTTETHLSNLKANTKYSARISAYNRKGDGVMSKSKIFHTPKLRPFPPKNVQIELLPEIASNKNVRARVKWEPPDNLKNGPKNFLMKYKLKETNKFTEIPVKDSLQYDIEDLKYGRTYEFRVSAVYDGEYSDEGRNTMTTPVGLPEVAPTEVRYEYSLTDANVLTFTWDPLPVESRNGEIVKYEVSLSIAAGQPQQPDGTQIEQSRTPFTQEVEKHEAEFKGVSPKTQYEFKIRAGTKKGYGPWSNLTIVKPNSRKNYFLTKHKKIGDIFCLYDNPSFRKEMNTKRYFRFGLKLFDEVCRTRIIKTGRI